jgi:DUF1680 family protein
LWVNLFVGSTVNLSIKNRNIQVSQVTNYPWDGKVQISIMPEKQTEFDLFVRIPGWANNQPAPGDAYSYLDSSSEKISLFVNGVPVTYNMMNGYAVIRKKWKKGDEVLLNMPMPVRRVVAIDEIKDNHNRVALQRGPLVYCFEFADNDGKAMNIVVPDNIIFSAEFDADLMNGIVVLKGEVPVATVSSDGLEISYARKKATAIPFYSWNNRGQGQMQVWLPRTIAEVRILAE